MLLGCMKRIRNGSFWNYQYLVIVSNVREMKFLFQLFIHVVLLFWGKKLGGTGTPPLALLLHNMIILSLNYM